MITRYTSAGLALLAFSVAIFAGLFSRNPFEVTLSRGLLALLLFFPLGLALGWAAQRVVNEFERQGEQRIQERFLSGSSRSEASPPGGEWSSGSDGGVE